MPSGLDSHTGARFILSTSRGISSSSRIGYRFDSVIRNESLDSQPINYLEFGVYKGESIKLWTSKISNPDSRFVGFDTFTGLPERWRRSEPKGWFNADGVIPDVKDGRASFEAGLFQDTVPAFLKRTDLSRRLVFNMDADLFTSTFYVLATFALHLKARGHFLL